MATRGHLVDDGREEEIVDWHKTNWNKILMPICPSKSSCSSGAFSVVRTFVRSGLFVLNTRLIKSAAASRVLHNIFKLEAEGSAIPMVMILGSF